MTTPNKHEPVQETPSPFDDDNAVKITLATSPSKVDSWAPWRADGSRLSTETLLVTVISATMLGAFAGPSGALVGGALGLIIAGAMFIAQGRESPKP